MKSSYTSVQQIELSFDLGLGEMDTIITALEEQVEGGSNSYGAKDLLRQIKSARAESIRQVRDSLKSYA